MDLKELYDQTKDLSVLLAEDHKPTRLGLEEIMIDLFKEVNAFSDGEEAYRSYLDRFDTNPYDLIITDIQMPNMDGVSLTKKIKALRPEQQIIVLSAYTDKAYLLELINIGISHFVTKPFNYNEFLQTLQYISRKVKTEKVSHMDIDQNILYLGSTMLWDKENQVLKHGDKAIPLSRNELFLMEMLAQNGEKITTTQSLIERFYISGVDISAGGIRNLVLRIRKKLPEDIIDTVYGMGYKLLLA